MARVARVEVFSADEVAVVHVMSRVVRRCFLLGDDPVTGKNFDHRKVWLETRLQKLAAFFGIDLLAFAILSNHFHLILRSRPDVVQTWSDTEVARRWLFLCPVRKDREGNAEEPNDMELNSIRNVPEKLEKIRLQLSDISWWMKLLCQHIAVRANLEDEESGKFWQNRFKAVKLLDESALLVCAAYVDLNPIRAAMAETLEDSDFTSVQRRIQAILAAQKTNEAQNASTTLDVRDSGLSESVASFHTMDDVQADQDPSADTPPAAKAPSQVIDLVADRFISPVTLDEQGDAIGPAVSGQGFRCSDKGFLPIPVAGYLELLDWTARQLAANKRGSTPLEAPPIFARLSIPAEDWCELIGKFGSLFCTVAGRPETIDATRSRVRQHRYHIRPQARRLLATATCG